MALPVLFACAGVLALARALLGNRYAKDAELRKSKSLLASVQDREFLARQRRVFLAIGIVSVILSLVTFLAVLGTSN